MSAVGIIALGSESRSTVTAELPKRTGTPRPMTMFGRAESVTTSRTAAPAVPRWKSVWRLSASKPAVCTELAPGGDMQFQTHAPAEWDSRISSPILGEGFAEALRRVGYRPHFVED